MKPRKEPRAGDFEKKGRGVVVRLCVFADDDQFYNIKMKI